MSIRLHSAYLTAFLLLTACGGGGGSDPGDGVVPPPVAGDDPGGFTIPLGEAGPTSYAHMLEYLDVIRDPANFDECLTTDPVNQPYKCLPGPRTGSGLGHVVHAWAESQLRAIDGIEAIQRQPFAFPIFQPRNYELQVQTPDGGVFSPAVFPWYFQGITPPEGVSGELLVLGNALLGGLFGPDMAGKIVVFNAGQVLNAQTVGAQEALDRASEAGAAGAIVAVEGPGNELVAQNYNTAQGLRDLPTLIVGEFDGDAINALEGQTAELIVDAVVERPGRSYNVYGFLPGQDRDNLLVIGTPINGWFTVGSERGPGVGGLIYLARYLADRAQREGPLPYTVVFAFTGAHEMLGFGQERVLRCLGPERVVTYVHLGAGLASTGYIEIRGEPVPTGIPATQRALVIGENSVLTPMVTTAFADVVATQAMTVSAGGVFNPGETRAAYNLKIPTFGISGAGLFHHSPADTEDKTSLDILSPVIESYRAVIDNLLDADPEAVRSGNAVADSLAGDPPGYQCPGAVTIP